MHILIPLAVIVSVIILVLGVLQVARDLFIWADPGPDCSDDEAGVDEGSNVNPAPTLIHRASEGDHS
jgi:hypothetical protein